MVKLLLDENLSPGAAVELRNEGHDVVHVRERGALGWSDPQVLDLAFAEDRVLVTANVADFRKLARAREIHAGIVFLLDGGLRRPAQLDLLRRLIVALAEEAGLVNRALTVAFDGGFIAEDLPLG